MCEIVFEKPTTHRPRIVDKETEVKYGQQHYFYGANEALVKHVEQWIGEEVKRYNIFPDTALNIMTHLLRKKADELEIMRTGGVEQ